MCSLVLNGLNMPPSLTNIPSILPLTLVHLTRSSSGKDRSLPACTAQCDVRHLHHGVGERYITVPSQPCLCLNGEGFTSLLWALYAYSIILNCTMYFKIHFSHSQDPIQELWLWHTEVICLVTWREKKIKISAWITTEFLFIMGD